MSFIQQRCVTLGGEKQVLVVFISSWVAYFNREATRATGGVH
jgi:hypothetical protein